MGLKGLREVVTGRRKLRFIDVVVPVIFTFYTVMRAVDRVFSTRISKIMESPAYATVYSNIIFTLGLFCAQIICSLGYIAFQRFYKKDKRYGLGFFSPISPLASTTGRYPQYLLFLFIIGDQLNTILLGWGAPRADQDLQNIFSQFALVFTVIFAYFILKTRYSQNHIIACVLVFLASFQTMTVEIQTNDPPLGTYTNGNGDTVKSPIIFIILLFLASIPAAAGNVFKQWCLQGVGSKYGELDIFYASTWSGFWQFILGLILIPLMWINFGGEGTPISPSTTGQAIGDTFTCFFGSAPPLRGNPTGQALIDQQNQQQLCAGSSGSAFEWFLVYSIFNLSFNVTLLWLTKYLSTTWAQVATGVVVGLSSILGQWKALMGPSATALSFEEYMGIVIMCVALWTYCLEDEVNADGEDVFLINKRRDEADGTVGDDKVHVDDLEQPHRSSQMLTTAQMANGESATKLIAR
uniref:Uncharacterized protein n=1 Tax=Mucochytrium quahogii TaxID=96639 RepID=A0A7S2RJ52_9STRA|mmetsp:Transcript_42535/g.68451  ORF Transcript_42535/g.68451 Transcript_42535/m.68451 type:complete len:466 (+) Transcript_42535:227-1624(+)